MKRLKARLKCRPRGFTQKNRDRLRPFLDERNQARFLGLSDKLLALARRRGLDVKAALLVQTALIHEIMLRAPMRFGNLVTLNLDRHFHFSEPGRAGKAHISIPPEEVKNGQQLDFPLPRRTAQLLQLYLSRYRPLLVRDIDQGCLFPGRVGGHKHEVGLREQLCRAVRRHTGLEVNPHLYRHLAAFLYLRANPGDYETVRRLLGHRSIETTITFYMDLERFTSVERYNKTILEREDQLRLR